MRLAISIVLAATLSPGAGNASERVPVMVGGHAEFDACQANGRVHKLGPVRPEDPKSGFLSVRSGPGGKPYAEIDRVYNGQELYVCHESGQWLAVVYPSSGQDPIACGVSSPIPRRQAYSGPCRAGWVHRSYVDIYAG